MKRSIIVLILCMCHSLAFAQVEPKMDSGSKALLFNFAGLDNLNANSFNGGIGGKFYISPTMVARVGIRFASATEDIPNNSDEGRDGEESGSTIGFSGAIEIHRGSGRVSPYFGGGFAFFSTKTELQVPTYNANASYFNVKNNGNGHNINGAYFRGQSGFDFFALLGVEFFILDEISLAAEYRLSYGTSSYKDEVIKVNPNVTGVPIPDPIITEYGSAGGFGIASAGFLTLAIYFN